MRVDSVELKVSFSPDQTPVALAALGDLGATPPPPWQIYFCEDINRGAPGTPLLDRGVILRARLRPGDDDVTVKLRPCRSSQLSDRWLADSDNVKVEADWAGRRRVLAASNTQGRRASLIRDVASGERPVRDLLTDEQRDFLANCADVAINLSALTVLPPVTAMRWEETDSLGPPSLGLRAERWTVDDLDFLELSAVAPIEEASAKEAAIAQFIESRGLQVTADQEPKTRQVMQHLIQRSLQAA